MPANRTFDNPTPDDLLTVTEVATYLAVSRTYVQSLIYRTRELPAVYIGNGRVLRVRRRDVDALIRPVND